MFPFDITKVRNTEDMGSISFWKTAVILLCYHHTLVTVSQRSFHVRKVVHVPPKMVRTKGLQYEHQLGMKLLRSSLINFPSVLHDFVKTKENLYATTVVIA